MLAGLGAGVVSQGATLAGATPAPEDAYLYIGWPNDGEVIDSCRFRVWFGLRDMGVAPAQVSPPNTGHHHLLVDVGLPPGEHSLQLIMGDRDHVPHDPPEVSERKTVTVRC